MENSNQRNRISKRVGLATILLFSSVFANTIVIPSYTCDIYQHYLTKAKQEKNLRYYHSPEHKARMQTSKIVTPLSMLTYFVGIGSFAYIMKGNKRRKCEK